MITFHKNHLVTKSQIRYFALLFIIRCRCLFYISSTSEIYDRQLYLFGKRMKVKSETWSCEKCHQYWTWNMQFIFSTFQKFLFKLYKIYLQSFFLPMKHSIAKWKLIIWKIVLEQTCVTLLRDIFSFLSNL